MKWIVIDAGHDLNFTDIQYPASPDALLRRAPKPGLPLFRGIDLLGRTLKTRRSPIPGQ